MSKQRQKIEKESIHKKCSKKMEKKVVSENKKISGEKQGQKERVNWRS